MRKPSFQKARAPVQSYRNKVSEPGFKVKHFLVQILYSVQIRYKVKVVCNSQWTWVVALLYYKPEGVILINFFSAFWPQFFISKIKELNKMVVC